MQYKILSKNIILGWLLKISASDYMIKTCSSYLRIAFMCLLFAGCIKTKDSGGQDNPSTGQYEADSENVIVNPARGWFVQYLGECCYDFQTSCNLPPVSMNSPHEPLASLATPLRISLKVANDGFARILTPRKVEIILRNKTTGDKYTIDVNGDGRGNRLWIPGAGEEKNLLIEKAVPAAITPGSYDLHLNLPNPYPRLHERPEYCIQLTNKNIWEATTGYNKLLQSITI